MKTLGALGNPSSPHEEGRKARAVLEEARTKIARLMEVKADDILFTSGATEANALAILGIPKAGDHVLYLSSAHASLVENVRALEARGVTVEPLPLSGGLVDIAAFRAVIRASTILVAMEAVCGETGTLWNTREVARVLASAAPQAFLHVDASQAPRSEFCTRSHFGADLLAFDASKAGGVPGIGCLIARRTIPLRPLYHGGGQERGLRSGTAHPASASAFAAALEACKDEREAFLAHAKGLRARLIASVQGISGVLINEFPAHVPHIMNLSFPGRDTDYLAALLDEKGFAVSTKSACETDSEDGSRAVFALTGDTGRARTTLRISFSPKTNAADVRRFAVALASAVAFLDAASA